MSKMVNTYRPGKPAHDTVTLAAADNLWSANAIDWPVSGDDTRLGHGTIGMRRVSQRVNIWVNVSDKVAA